MAYLKIRGYKQSKLGLNIWRCRHLVAVMLFVSITLFYFNKSVENEVLKRIPQDAAKFILFKMQKTKKIDILRITEIVQKRNTLQYVRNTENFGPVDNNTLILVILVGKYSLNLKYFIASLSQLRGIDDILLIFSHSYLDENVDNLIISIKFAKVLQIYYPYSIQLFPWEFPGYQQDDCPYNMKMKTAESVNCIGAFSPDIHGRYRHPRHAETKHHWWWTANTVFENLQSTANKNGFVLFLKDDFYLLDDFIYMVSRMRKISKYFLRCDFISLGTDSFSNYETNMSYTVELQTWNPEQHSFVFGFDSAIWHKIVSHYDLFCSVDDSSWSRSLFYISTSNNVGEEFKVLSSLMPRAFKTSIRPWGRWWRGDVAKNVLNVLDLGRKIKKELYPPFIETYVNLDIDDLLFYDFGLSSGGWSDPRDKMLCVNMTESKIKKVVLDRQNIFSN